MQMHTLGRVCLLVAAGHSVIGLYHKFLRLSLRFLFMDFPSTFKFLTQASELGCGFVLLGYFSRIFNLIGLILIFGFCLKILRSSEFGAAAPRFRYRPKVQSLERTPLKSPISEDGVSDEKDENLEDEMFDVMSLRKLVKIERQRYNSACAEIEKERVAASTAAEEAMAMILRLQSEKSSVEIQANQFRRMVEEKEEYDQEVIESLRWTVVQLESQKSLLEQQLVIYGEKLSQFTKDDDDDDDDDDEMDQIEGDDVGDDEMDQPEGDDGDKMDQPEGDGGDKKDQIEGDDDNKIEQLEGGDDDKIDQIEGDDDVDVSKDFCNFSVEYEDVDASLETAHLNTL